MSKEKKNNLLMISEFSKIAEVSRKALIFYDKIGVFSPVYTAPNGYRYYSHEQVYLISAVNLLRELDTPLEEIKNYMKDCTPERAKKLLEQQGDQLTQEIRRLQGIQDMLRIKLDRLEAGSRQTIGKISVDYQKKSPLFISDSIKLKKNKIPDDIWTNFYIKCRAHNVAFGYPEGFLVKKEQLIKEETDVASHIICHVGSGHYANAYMPEGTYLSVCGHGSFQDTGPLYQQLLSYAKEHNLIIIGDAYEERLLDEITSEDSAIQMIQVKIQIRQENIPVISNSELSGT
ncbi:MAG: MerR family transcriptional regulator [Clostridiales bacterium]|nr:MerR family transcriptional regulator [Clostridiales bacterium]